MIKIVPLADVASSDIETLLDEAFGTDRHRRTAYRIREGMPQLDSLSFAAVESDLLVGSLQSWPVALTGPARSVPLVLVGPVAVRLQLQRCGIGKALMHALIAAAPAAGVDAMTMIGDPEYYDRFFGFSNAQTGGWDLPGPFDQRRLLALITRRDGLPKTGMLGPDPAYAQKAIAA